LSKKIEKAAYRNTVSRFFAFCPEGVTYASIGQRPVEKNKYNNDNDYNKKTHIA
jgi:hypothetical protein